MTEELNERHAAQRGLDEPTCSARCENCMHWEEMGSKYGGDPRNGRGICNSEKFIESAPCDEDGLEYYDYEGYSAGFYTGPKFGCVHFKPNVAHQPPSVSEVG